MSKPKYNFICQVCNKPFKATYPWEKACDKHKKEYQLQKNREVCRTRYAIYKAKLDYLNR